MTEVAAPVAPTVASAAPAQGAKPAPVAAKPSGTAPPPPKEAGKPAEAKTYEIDGKTYTDGQLRAFLKRGEEGSKLMSTAAQKMAEADKRIAEAEEREKVFKSGDRKAIFNKLRELGHDPRLMSEEELNEAIKDEMLSPEQRELRDTKAKLTAKEKAEEEAKAKVQEEETAAEVQKLTDTYAQTMVDALHSKGIPLSHARDLLPHYAQLVRAYDKTGKAPDMESVAEYLAEKDSQSFERNLGSMEVDDILARLGPEKEKALINRAVARYKEQKAGKVGGVLPGAPTQAPAATGKLPAWVKELPAETRRAYFEGGEGHPDVKAWLARRPGR